MAFNNSAYLKKNGVGMGVVFTSKKKSTAVQFLTVILLETLQEHTVMAHLSNRRGPGNDNKEGTLVIGVTLHLVYIS